MSHAEQLEQETEQTRAQIADTLDELRACMTPGHVLHQLADRMSDGAAAAFARNLKDQTVNNPLPVALIGAGLAWLMLSPRGSSSTTGRAGGDAAGTVGDAAGSMADSAQQGAAQTADTVRETAGSMADSAQETANQATMRGSAGSMSDSIQRAASAGYEGITEGARRSASSLSESTKIAKQRTLQSGSAFIDFCRDQPVVLAGLGLAVGAVIGTFLPTSETEDRLMGETSDRVKERVQDLASEQYESAKRVGERAFDAAKDEAVNQAHNEEKDGESKDEKEATAGDVKAEGATLVPSDESELERRGQPWTAKNAPL
jgi:hypothetical protein